jgi:hypothetical protein
VVLLLCLKKREGIIVEILSERATGQATSNRRTWMTYSDPAARDLRRIKAPTSSSYGCPPLDI